MNESSLEIIKAQNITIKMLAEQVRELTRLQEENEMCSCSEQHPFFNYLIDLADELAHTKNITDEYKQNILYTFTKGLLVL